MAKQKWTKGTSGCLTRSATIRIEKFINNVRPPTGNKIMKEVFIKRIEKGEMFDDPARMQKVFRAWGKELEVSDGYHTFDELYEHRVTLYIALTQLLKRRENAIGFIPKGESFVWRSKLHSDGTGYEGWFILGIGKEKGKQITYHLPLSKWDDTEFAETLEKAPEWDEHSATDVLERLKTL